MSDRLWAPWRLAYVAAEPASERKPLGDGPEDCFICRGLAGSEDRKNLIVGRSTANVVLLNKYPYNNGHLLVCPQRHTATLDDLSPDELLDAMESLRTLTGILKRRMKPDGFNIGLNLGRAAGAGLPGHLHWHIVPRWNGDTNFMPVVGDVKVMVQSLDALYEIIAEELPPAGYTRREGA